jgi:carboxymethylenebutenolidase
MGRLVNLTAADGIGVQAYRAEPVGVPRGGLVVVQEIIGINDHIRTTCDRFAEDGYVAVAPALFDRYQRGVSLGYAPEDIARGRQLKAHARTDIALTDIAAARVSVAGAGKVGIVGYCWGGFITWMSAARLAGFACAVCYYGGGMVEATDERPLCPVMAHFGKRDTGIPVDGVRRFSEMHPEVKVFLYDADHAFNNDQRKSYDATAAKLARERTVDFLNGNIGA